MDDLISQMAQLIIEQNRTIVGSDVADDAIARVKQEKQERKQQKEGKTKEGGTEANVKEKTTKRRRTTKSA